MTSKGNISECSRPFYPCTSGIGGVRTLNTSLLFKGGALDWTSNSKSSFTSKEVKDDLEFEVPWCPGYIDGLSGYYGSDSERTHMSTPAQLEVKGRGMRTHIWSRQWGGCPWQQRGDCFLTWHWCNSIHVWVIYTGIPGWGALRERALALAIDEQCSSNEADRCYTSYNTTSDGSPVWGASLNRIRRINSGGCKAREEEQGY